MATLSYPRHPHIASQLVRELPTRIKEVRQIHDINYALVISSVIITAAIIALAWLVTVNTTLPDKVSPLSEIAETAPYVQTFQSQSSHETRPTQFGALASR